MRQRIGIESVHYRGSDDPQPDPCDGTYVGEVGRHVVVPNRQIVVQEGGHLEGLSGFE